MASDIDEKNGWGQEAWTFNGNIRYEEEWTYQCQHKWIDTGMRKTFCKHCDAEGELDPMTGQVTLVFKNKEGDGKK